MVPVPDPAESDLAGVARDAETIIDVLRELEPLGYTTQFLPVSVTADEPPSDEVECVTCRHCVPTASLASLPLRRLEGASDPDDMVAIAAMECPRCGARGTMVLHYGPLATPEDDAILGALTASERAPHLPGNHRVQARADALQSEERRAGTTDASAQAEAILTDSDARLAEVSGPIPLAIERRRSEETVEPTG
jgi:hypothetical protein